MAKCWLCLKDFPNKTALNSHLVSREHRRQTVLCVFCPTEKSFMKPGDLERHCRTLHFSECKNLSRAFFSTGNCMYFSVFPEDYIQTISKAESWNSGDAIQARGFMKSHLESQVGGSVKFQLMQQGWRRALKLRLFEESKNEQSDTLIDTSTKDGETGKIKVTEKDIKTTNMKGKENTERQNDGKLSENEHVNNNETGRQEDSEGVKSKSVETEIDTSENENNEKDQPNKSVNETEVKGVTDNKPRSGGKESDDKSLEIFEYSDRNVLTERQQGRNDNIKESEKNELKLKVNKDSVDITETKKDDNNKRGEHKKSEKRKHRHKHKSKRQQGDEERNIKIKKQKVKKENKENTKLDIHDSKQTDTNGNGENDREKSKPKIEISDKKVVKECFVTLSDCENQTSTKIQLLDEKEDPLKGEIPLMKEILTDKLNQANQKLETNHVEPKKMSYNEYLKKKEDKVPETNKETLKTESRKNVSFVRDENNIWRRETIPAEKKYIATKLTTETKENTDENREYEFDVYAGIPNRYQLSMGIYESELRYDPEGRVEINWEKAMGQGRGIDKEGMRSGDETPLMDETGSVEDLSDEVNYGIGKDRNREMEGDNQGLTQNDDEIMDTNKHEQMDTNKQEQMDTNKHESLSTNENERTKIVPQVNMNTMQDAKSTEMQELAKDLLITGVMPLCPPGRRDWGSEIQYSLPEISFTWPPADWKQMTPDRRLLAWEFAAMSLQNATEGSIDPGLSRAYLMDKFNFLALPGSAKHLKDREEVAASRARFYGYQMVREVASGKPVTNAVEMHLKCLEGTRNVSDDFKLRLRTIEAPLRLNLEK